MIQAQGRLPVGKPVAIVDIGSNSVRLVVYEGLTRAPTPIFNEKVLCGLGKGVMTTGLLPADGVIKALAALRRFRSLCEIIQAREVYAFATAAAREAINGPEFLAAATQAIGRPIELISGAREAHLSALGVISTVFRPDGVVGDLGGGSLELVDVKGMRAGQGVSLPLGTLALMDASGKSPKVATKIVRSALAKVKPLQALRGRTFYAVGGTWRSLAKLHMLQRNYPLRVLHGYIISAREAMDFAALVERVDSEALVAVGAISTQRRPSLAYGAVVLEEIIRVAKPAQVFMSIGGVREGLLFERLDEDVRKRDPLLEAAREFNVLRSRAPLHGEDLVEWTDRFIRSTHLDETPEEKRLRHAACLIGDIGWRAPADYRSEQSLNMIANAAISGVDHAGRAFLAMSVAYRHIGLDEDVSPQMRSLVPPRLLDRARILGAVQRVAYIITASMPGVLPRAPLSSTRTKVVLTLPPDLAALASDRLNARLKQLARLIGRTQEILIED